MSTESGDGTRAPWAGNAAIQSSFIVFLCCGPGRGYVLGASYLSLYSCSRSRYSCVVVCIMNTSRQGTGPWCALPPHRFWLFYFHMSVQDVVAMRASLIEQGIANIKYVGRWQLIYRPRAEAMFKSGRRVGDFEVKVLSNDKRWVWPNGKRCRSVKEIYDMYASMSKRTGNIPNDTLEEQTALNPQHISVRSMVTRIHTPTSYRMVDNNVEVPNDTSVGTPEASAVEPHTEGVDAEGVDVESVDVESASANVTIDMADVAGPQVSVDNAMVISDETVVDTVVAVVKDTTVDTDTAPSGANDNADVLPMEEDASEALHDHQADGVPDLLRYMQQYNLSPLEVLQRLQASANAAIGSTAAADVVSSPPHDAAEVDSVISILAASTDSTPMITTPPLITAQMFQFTGAAAIGVMRQYEACNQMKEVHRRSLLGYYSVRDISQLCATVVVDAQITYLLPDKSNAIGIIVNTQVRRGRIILVHVSEGKQGQGFARLLATRVMANVPKNGSLTVDSPACTAKVAVKFWLSLGFMCDDNLMKCTLADDASFIDKNSTRLTFTWHECESANDKATRMVYLTAASAAHPDISVACARGMLVP